MVGGAEVAGVSGAAALVALAGGPAVRAAPSATSLIAVLTGVAATSSRRAWAVGFTDEFGQASRQVILRWEGSAWRRVGGLRPADATLTGVAAVSAADAWAVGYHHGALIMHWAGGHWRRAATPKEGSGSKLLGVAALSARSAWAVGCVSCAISGGQPLALKWNGTSWRRARLPGLAPTGNCLAWRPHRPGTRGRSAAARAASPRASR